MSLRFNCCSNLYYNINHKIGDRLARKFANISSLDDLKREVGKRFLNFEELTFCSLEFNILVRSFNQSNTENDT